MSAPEAQPGTGKPPDRRPERRSVDLRGYIVRNGGISHAIELVDVNYGGCGINVAAELMRGETVQLMVLAVAPSLRRCAGSGTVAPVSTSR